MSKFRRIVPVQKLIYMLFIAVLLCQGLYINVPKAFATDTTPPTLTSLSFSKSSVDTTSTEDVITVTATMTDASDGLGGFGIGLSSPDNSAGASGACLVGAAFVNGSATCVATVKFPKNLPSGTWTVYVDMHDSVNNSTRLYEYDLSAAGFPNTVEVTSN